MIVNTADSGGGAERIAMTLLDGFEGLGTETWMAVGRKHTEHPRVVPFYLSPHIDYRLHGTRLRRAGVKARRYLERRLGLEDFNHPYTRVLGELTGPRPDVLFCNNLHGGYFDLRELARLSQKFPVVLRLADSWTFTGHCAVPKGCERWRTGCGRCPDLTIPPAIERDATRLNWHRKRRIFASSRLFVTAPSRWLLERARQSILAPAIAGARVIPNGVDLDVFTPEGARAPWPEPEPDTRRLLFVANGGAANPYKDFATLRAALRQLEGPVELVTVGGQKRVEDLGGGIRIRHEPPQQPERLAGLYRSADAYVHAAFEEAFSLTVTEALACGTPVVASGNGLGEVVDHERTGLLIPPGDPVGMATALRRLLTDRGLRERMGASAASAGRSRFDSNRMIEQTHALCEDALLANGTAPRV